MDIVTNSKNVRKTAGFITPSVLFAERRIIHMKKRTNLDNIRRHEETRRKASEVASGICAGLFLVLALVMIILAIN